MRCALVVMVAACAPSFAERVATRAEPAASALVVDVASGATLASAGDVDKVVLPLSLVKLYVAALWWQHGFGDDASVENILVHSDDRAGMLLAAELRRRVGEPTVVAELSALGLRIALRQGVDDVRWGETLSIGEHDVTVTLPAVAQFLRDLTRRHDPRLFAAMRACVERGTARGSAARLDGTRWHLGGKTGTGPAERTPHDGWFAGIAFEGDLPRYVIAVYEPGRGLGGGVAARLAADLVWFLG
jgi:hypothetical protein